MVRPKRSVILLVLSILMYQSYSQDQALFKPITVSFKKVTIDSALNIIENKIDFNFTYNSEFTLNQKPVDAAFTEVPLCIVLDSLFRDPFITYKIVDRQLVIYKKESETATKLDDPPLSTKNTTAQTFKIQGTIVDSKTLDPMPFAAIGFLNKNKGTISNSDGNFNLNYDENFINDTLIISYLGYQHLEIPVQQLRPNDTYSIVQKSISLQEVIIRSTEPRNLIQQALAKITSNYDINPFIQRAFYRETVKRNDNYMVYTEALFDIFKSAYRPTLYDDQIRMLKQRKFTNINTQDTVLFKLHGGLSTSLILDVIKHPIDFLDTDHLDEYRYSIRDVVLIDNEMAYLIEFKPYRQNLEMSYTGEIYININSLAIVKVNFNFTRESIKKLKSSFIIKQSRSIKAHPIDAEYSIAYKKSLNGLYYINHIKGCLKLKARHKSKLLASVYQTSFEMVSTDLNYTDVNRFSRKETINSRRIFSDVNNPYNSSYWVDENFIMPEENLSKALLRFRQEELILENK